MSSSSLKQCSIPVVVRLGVMLIVSAANPIMTSGQTRTDTQSAPHIDEVRVPTDRLQQHLTPQHVAMELMEYRRLLAASIPVPSAVRVDRADYSAKFVDAALQLGRLTARVTNDSATPALLQLDPLNLNVSVLNWTRGNAKRPAVWGTSPTGKIVLLVDPGTHQLEGIWRFVGTSLPDRVDFKVKLIPAAVSRLTIETAGAEIIEASSGVSGRGAKNAEGWTEWTIPVGGRTDCNLQVLTTDSNRRLPPTAFIESSLAFRLLKDEVRVNASFLADVINEPIDRVDITLPVDWEVLSLTYAGDFSLPWSRDTNVPSLLHVSLPSPVLGRSREIHLRAVRPLQPPKLWRSPAIDLSACYLSEGLGKRVTATSMQGTLDLSVVAPLQVQSLAPTGFLQRQVVLNSKDEESFSFVRFQANGRLTAVLAEPKPRLSARIVGSLIVDKQNWMLTSIIECRSVEGASYRLQCSLQDGWEVLEVHNLGADESDVQWTLSPKRPRGKRSLEFQFPRAATAEAPVRLHVALRKRRRTTANEFSLLTPVLDPTNCQRVERTLAIEGRSRRKPRVDTESFALVLASTLTKSVLNDLKTVGGNAIKSQIYVADQSLAPTLRITTIDQTQPMRVQATTTAKIDRTKLVETCEFDVKPSRAVDRIVVFLSTTGPLPQWEADSEAFTISPQRLPPDRHEEWGLPIAGELWEIRLSRPLASPFIIRAVRGRSLETVDFATVCSVVNAEAFSGRIHVQDPAGALLETWPFEMTALSSTEVRDAANPDE